MSRDDQADTRRGAGGPHNRASYLVEMEELTEPNTIAQENAAGYTVGPNAPIGGKIPRSYTIGSRGGPIITQIEEQDSNG